MGEELAGFEGVARRLDELAARLARVEARLKLDDEASPVQQPADSAEGDVDGLVMFPQVSLPRARVAVSASAPVLAADATQPALDVAASVPAVDVRAAFKYNAGAAKSKAATDQTRAPSLERLIGGKFYLIAGSIVVVLGVGLFLKLGYDAGWFRMAPMWKCLWGAAFGLSMLALGEMARKRVSPMASAGISSAGMGALFASIYAAHGHYGLIGPSWAFALLVAATATGITVAARARLLSVAVLSIVGGYAAPFMLQVTNPNPYVLGLHLLALLATGLVLSGWQRSPFRPLRGIVWWGTMVIGAVYVLFQGLQRPELALMFLGLVWVGVHLELMWGAGAWVREGDSDEQVVHPLLSWQVIRPVGTSFSTTSWSVLLGVFVLRQTSVLPDWFAPAGVMVGASVLSIMLVGHLRVLRDPPETEAQRLGAGLAMQGGAMLIAVVALALQGWLEVTAWLALGVAATGAAAWIRSKGLGIYGVVILSIAAARLVTYDAFVLRTPLVGTRVLGLVLDRWTLLALLTAAAWSAAAVLLVRLGRGAIFAGVEKEWPLTVTGHGSEGAVAAAPAISRKGRGLAPPVWIGDSWWLLPRLCGVVGMVLLFGGLIHPKEDIGSLSFAWVVLSMVVLALGRRFKGMWLDWLCPLGLLAAIVAWLLAYVPENWNNAAEGFVMHPGLGVCLAIAAALVTVARVLQGRGATPNPDVDPRPAFSIFVACAVVLTGVSLEVMRVAQNSGVSPSAEIGWLCVAWIGVAGGMEILRRAMKCEWLPLLAMTLLELAIGVWAWGYVQPGWQATSAGRPMHPALLVAIALAAALVLLGQLRRLQLFDWSENQNEPHSQAWNEADFAGTMGGGRSPEAGISASLFAFVCAGVLTWAATSFEIARLAKVATSDATVQSAAVSIWWGAVAAVLLFFGFRNKMRLPRYVGLGLLGVATVKAVVVDLADVPPIWRVVSVLGLGLLMLAVAVVYAKVSDGLLGADERTDAKTGPEV
ncbi:MAG: DUF2339 domain-containing protein [Pyrinomonadaceae bacterium]|nr:DUF2339 domain-containing protein [Phycisphaerales bacterium]